MSERDLYSVLGVARDSSEGDIKQAYRRLARQCHPDLNPGDKKAEERFKEASAAVDVLGDPDKRKLYDEFGESSLQAGFDPEQAKAYQQWQRRSQASDSFHGAPRQTYGTGEVDLEDLFGGVSGFGGAPKRKRSGQNIESRLQISLRESVLGGERELMLERPQLCADCRGSGAAPKGGPPVSCPMCYGTGQQQIAQGPLSYQTTCATCGGRGSSAPACGSCGGQGHRPGQTRLNVKVPAGIMDGQSIRLKGQGVPGEQGAGAGDLLIQIEIAPHPLLRREGRDLYLDLPITVREALLGAKVDVPTFDGNIRLSVPAGAQSGSTLRVKGKGSGRPSGDLYVVLQVMLPEAKKDPAVAERAANDLEKLYPHPVRSELRL